jgi:DNA polymerase III subunit epsilon
MLNRRKLDVALEVAGVLAYDPVFLDTETTGLDDRAEVVEVAVIALDGRVLVDSLVRPTIPIPGTATAVHGIGPLDVADAPTFAELWSKLAAAIEGHVVVIYNAAYDIRALHQSARACSIGLLPWTSPHFCMMTAYAEYWGDWSDWHGNYKWQSLSAAAAQQQLVVPTNLHRAGADAELTRRLACHIAAAQLSALAAGTPIKVGVSGC